jgi:preprotein translocase subunit SecG
LRSGPTKYMQTAKYILFVIFLANKILLAKIAYNDKKQL